MDVKSTFLNGILEKEFCVDQPLGFHIRGKEYKVYILKKAMYDLKKDIRAWYSHIDSDFINNGFNMNNNEPTLYTK
jgi:hypothetical protein